MPTKHKKGKDQSYKVQETINEIPGMPNKEVVVPTKPNGMITYGMNSNKLTNTNIPAGIPTSTPIGQSLAKQQAELNNQSILNDATETRSKEERELDPNNKIFDPDKVVEEFLDKKEGFSDEAKEEKEAKEQAIENSNQLLQEQQEQELKDDVNNGSAPAEAYTESTNTAVQEANANDNTDDNTEDNTESNTETEMNQEVKETLKGKLRNKLNSWRDSQVQKAVERTGDGRARNIMDAYLTGQISKGERNYYLADAFANFAKELGRNANNVGAAFTGGAIDNSTNTSAWQDRQNTLNENAAQAAAEQEGGPAARQAKSEELANTSAELGNQIKQVDADYASREKEAQVRTAEANAKLQEVMAEYTPKEKEAQLSVMQNLATNAKSMTELMDNIDKSTAINDKSKPALKIWAQSIGSLPMIVGSLMMKAF